MYEGLSLDTCPEYLFSSFRYFEKHEKFVTRFCGEDILVVMLDGVLRFHEDGIATELHPGEYYIMKRGLFQQGVEESDEPRYYYIHFTGSYASAGNILPLRGTAKIDQLFPLFRELDLSVAANSARIVSSSIFFRILSILSGEHSASQNAIVHQVLSYVLQKASPDTTLDEISSAIGYCKNHIINTFKRETGKTPHSYIAEQRIGAARQLMLHSDLSLEQIAIHCGFGNYIRFYRNFMEIEKISPSRWRKAHRREEAFSAPAKRR